MLTKKTPETIKATLKVKSQGVENTLLLTYNNRTPEQYKAFVENPENFTPPESVAAEDGISHINANLVLFLVKSFDDGTDKEFPLTYDGLMELDKFWPNTLYGIIQGYHQARAAAVEKN